MVDVSPADLVYTEKEVQHFLLPLARMITNLYDNKKIRQKTKIIGIQGGPGTGKSTLAKFLKAHLESIGYSVVIFSIDDFYLSWKQRQVIQKKHPHNPFYQISRGMPGTHDVAKLSKVLSQIKKGRSFILPVFDKSLHHGNGDVSETKKITKRPDFVIFEGWFLGMKTVPSSKFIEICKKNKIFSELQKLDPALKFHQTVLHQNKNYQKLWKKIDYMILLKASMPKLHHQWRLKQEKELRWQKGKASAMSDKQVKKFVAPYLPFTYLAYDTLKFDTGFLINNKHQFDKILKLT